MSGGLAEQFMSAAVTAPGGNTPWASRYGAVIRSVFHAYAARSPRSLQRNLGPSELGTECDRQVVGKMLGEPVTNHVTDPWPSIRGTALHAYADDAFTWHNTHAGERWIPEMKVEGITGHPGTADLYDALEYAVVDHKFLGESTLAKLHNQGPPRKYLVQLLIYAAGYRRLRARVDRVVLAAYPATKASLDDMYVWERPYTSADDELLAVVERETADRKHFAEMVQNGVLDLKQIPTKPDDSECYFCPFYRPEVARNASLPGCSGNRNTTQGESA